MHYKLQFWDHQFKSLIQFHIDTGSDFDIVSAGPNNSSLTISRLDYGRTNGTAFLKYEVKLDDGGKVTYTVYRIPEGYDIKLNSVEMHNVFLTTDDGECEPVMRDCYLLMVKNLSTFWFQ